MLFEKSIAHQRLIHFHKFRIEQVKNQFYKENSKNSSSKPTFYLLWRHERTLFSPEKNSKLFEKFLKWFNFIASLLPVS